MPPKKQQQAAERVLLGRPGNNLKMGVVGLPNVGKSTFFNALTNSSAPAENFPFCTIDKEEARVAVPDSRIDKLFEIFKSDKKVPAYLSVIDIAGLVKGAAEGEGLGNAFLSHIKAVDGIFHVCRTFDDPDVIHVEGDVNPVRDLDIIHNELRLKDEEYINKQVSASAKDITARGDKQKKDELETLRKVQDWVCNQRKDVREGSWNNKEVEFINTLQLITAKPVVYLANLSEKDYVFKKNKWLPKLKQWIDENHPGDLLIPYSGVVELNLTQMETDEEREAYLRSLQQKYEVPNPVTSVLPKIIHAGYNALNLVYYFTCGPMEVRCWTIRKGSKAPQAAGVIHTDFEKGFIMGEIMRYEDLVEHGSEAAVKAAGKYHQKGRDYVVTDGDICHWKSGQITKKK